MHTLVQHTAEDLVVAQQDFHEKIYSNMLNCIIALQQISHALVNGIM